VQPGSIAKRNDARRDNVCHRKFQVALARGTASVPRAFVCDLHPTTLVYVSTLLMTTRAKSREMSVGTQAGVWEDFVRAEA
jgi:hypothetical protein